MASYVSIGEHTVVFGVAVASKVTEAGKIQPIYKTVRVPYTCKQAYNNVREAHQAALDSLLTLVVKDGLDKGKPLPLRWNRPRVIQGAGFIQFQTVQTALEVYGELVQAFGGEYRDNRTAEQRNAA